MKYLCFIIFFLPFFGWSQSDSLLDSDILDVDYIEEDELHRLIHPIEIVFDSIAEFPGGEKALYTYLNNEIKLDSTSSNINGKVYLLFEINTDGTIGEVKVFNTDNNYLKELLTGVARKMPKWSPAIKDGKKIAVKLTVPIMINLR